MYIIFHLKLEHHISENISYDSNYIMECNNIMSGETLILMIDKEIPLAFFFTLLVGEGYRYRGYFRTASR